VPITLEQRAEREDRGVQLRRAMQVAAHADAAGHRVQRGQQHDERDVLLEQRVHERTGAVPAPNNGERRQERNRPRGGDLAEMVMPEHGRDQREHRDRQQDPGERDAPRGQRGTVERGGRCERRNRAKRSARRHARPGGMSFHAERPSTSEVRCGRRVMRRAR
jgi:hypothetical protein